MWPFKRKKQQPKKDIKGPSYVTSNGDVIRKSHVIKKSPTGRLNPYDNPPIQRMNNPMLDDPMHPLNPLNPLNPFSPLYIGNQFNPSNSTPDTHFTPVEHFPSIQHDISPPNTGDAGLASTPSYDVPSPSYDAPSYDSGSSSFDSGSSSFDSGSN